MRSRLSPWGLVAVALVMTSGCAKTEHVEPAPTPEAQGAAPSPGSPPPRSGWAVVTDAGSGVAAVFPEAPEEVTVPRAPARSPGGEARRWQLEDAEAGWRFRLEIGPLVGDGLARGGREDVQQQLGILARGGAAARPGDLAPVQQGGVSGHEVTVTREGPPPFTQVTRSFVIGRRYVVIQARYRAAADAGRARRFLGGVDLTGLASRSRGEAGWLDAWQAYESGLGAFTAWLPAAPQEGITRQKTPWGEREVWTATALGADPAAAYSVLITPHPEKAPAAALDAWQEARSEPPPGAPPRDQLVRRDVTVSKRPARLLGFAVKRADQPPSVAYWLAVVDGAQLFELSVLPIDPGAGVAEVARFFESFEITD